MESLLGLLTVPSPDPRTSSRRRSLRSLRSVKFHAHTPEGKVLDGFTLVVLELKPWLLRYWVELRATRGSWLCLTWDGEPQLWLRGTAGAAVASPSSISFRGAARVWHRTPRYVRITCRARRHRHGTLTQARQLGSSEGIMLQVHLCVRDRVEGGLEGPWHGTNGSFGSLCIRC